MTNNQATTSHAPVRKSKRLLNCENTLELPVSSNDMKRSIETVQSEPENSAPKRVKRGPKAGKTLTPCSSKRREREEDVVVGKPAKKVKQERRKILKKQVSVSPALDLSKHIILPNSSYVEHLSRVQKAKEVEEDDEFFDTVEDTEEISSTNEGLAMPVISPEPAVASLELAAASLEPIVAVSQEHIAVASPKPATSPELIVSVPEPTAVVSASPEPIVAAPLEPAAAVKSSTEKKSQGFIPWLKSYFF